MGLRETFLKKQRLADLFRVLSLRLLFSIFSFILALYVFALLTEEIIFDRHHDFDHQVFRFLAPYTTEDVVSVMKFFTFFGKPDFLIPAYLLLIGFFMVLKKRKYALETAITGTSSTLLLFGLKKLFGRERPDIPVIEDISGYSYPSGHALLGFVFFSLLVYLVWNSHLRNSWKWTLSILLILFSIVVGISRIVLRVHYFTDVVAGFCLGYAWVLIALWAQRRFMKVKHRAVENHPG